MKKQHIYLEQVTMLQNTIGIGRIEIMMSKFCQP